MTVESLLYFMSIAEGTTYMETAELFNISQSALSKAIIRLENEIGFQLFDRGNRSVKLTVAGQYIYSDLLNMRAGYDRLTRHIRALGRNRQITIYTIPSLTSLGLPTIFRDFTEKHPEISLNTSFLAPKALSVADGKEKCAAMIEELRNCRLDYLIMHQPKTLTDDIEATVLHEDSYFVILPKEHILANRDTIDFYELKDEPFELNTWGAMVIDEICEKYDIVLSNKRVSDLSRESILMNIWANNKVGFFYASDLSYFSLSNFSVHRVTGVECPKWVILNSRNNAFTEEHRLLKEFVLNSMNNIVMPMF